jgi:hypothetical protein
LISRDYCQTRLRRKTKSRSICISLCDLIFLQHSARHDDANAEKSGRCGRKKQQERTREEVMPRAGPASTRAIRIGLATFVGAVLALLASTEAPRAAEPKKGGSVGIWMESDLMELDLMESGLPTRGRARCDFGNEE